MASKPEPIKRVIQMCKVCLKDATHLITSREIVCYHCGAVTLVPRYPRQMVLADFDQEGG